MESKNVVAEPKSESLEEQLEQLQPVLYRYCVSLTGSVQDAEDLSQQTWMKTFRRLKEHSHPNPEAFLLRVAKNGWIDECRRRKGLRERMQWLHELEDIGAGSEPFEAERAIVALLRYLSPIQRAVFMLRDALDYSIAETAKLLGTSEGAVKAALFRARRALGYVHAACTRNRAEHEREDWPGAQAEELAQQILHAYVEGRTEELIVLVQSQPAGMEGLVVVGHRMQDNKMRSILTTFGPQASYSNGSAVYGIDPAYVMGFTA
ncbi:RNA polymerase sigma factor [Paenibacillus sp. strain BS8-2]